MIRKRQITIDIGFVSILSMFVLTNLSVNAQDLIINKTDTSITFKVDDVELKDSILPLHPIRMLSREPST
jgi:hypothetical protein